MRAGPEPGPARHDGRTATVRGRTRFAGSVLELVNCGWADYNALQMSLHKRFSTSYQFRVSLHAIEGRRHHRGRRRDRDDHHSDVR